MPNFDMDKLFDYLIIIVVVVGPLVAAGAKKLITFFSPESPEAPSQSTVAVPGAQRSKARPIVPIAPTPARPASLPPRDPQRGRPAPPRPVARRVVLDGPSIAEAVRQVRSREDVPMTLEVAVEEHLGHLTSSIDGETERVDRGVEKRLKRFKTNIKPQEQKSERPAAPSKSDTLRKLTRQDIRRAILLREVLGPPVALRAPNESW